jgi:hypothetical protein
MASATGQRRIGHPRRTGACSVFQQFHKTQKGQSFQATLLRLVEAAGVEFYLQITDFKDK